MKRNCQRGIWEGKPLFWLPSPFIRGTGSSKASMGGLPSPGQMVSGQNRLCLHRDTDEQSISTSGSVLVSLPYWLCPSLEAMGGWRLQGNCIFQTPQDRGTWTLRGCDSAHKTCTGSNQMKSQQGKGKETQDSILSQELFCNWCLLGKGEICNPFSPVECRWVYQPQSRADPLPQSSWLA